MPLTIICDIDSTIADLFTPWLDAYNHDYDDALSVADIRDYDLSRIVKLECGRRIFDYLAEPGLFLHAQPFQGAIETLRALTNEGHRIYIATDCFFPANAKEKMEWCLDVLSFVPRDRIMLGAPKHLLRADVFIDDSPEQVERYVIAWGSAPLILTLGYPYNERVAPIADVYARDWRSPELAWRKFADAIRSRDATMPFGRRVPVVEHSPVEVEK